MSEIPRWIGIVAFLILIWWILTGYFHNEVIYAYSSTNLPNAMMIVDSIFFGAIFVVITVFISIEGMTSSAEYRKNVARRLLDTSGAVTILIIANLSSYFVSGVLKTVAIYYQIWALPSLFLNFYILLLNIVKNSSGKS